MNYFRKIFSNLLGLIKETLFGTQSTPSKKGTKIPEKIKPQKEIKEQTKNTQVDFFTYKKNDCLFTKNEEKFYIFLKNELGEKYAIFTKVRLLDLFNIPKKTENYMTYFNKIKAKHVDFVLCDPNNFNPIVAIELDGWSHNMKSAQKNDTFKNNLFKQADFPLERVKVSKTYEKNDLNFLA